MVEMISQTGLVVACLLDLLLGDPEWSFHPIRILGKTIDCLEKYLRGIKQSLISEKTAGILLCVITITLAYGITFGLIHFAYTLNSYFGASLAILLAYFTISIKSLGDAAGRIRQCLKDEDDESAGRHLSLIVGRDTLALSRKEIVRATVETVAENTSDGIVAPLFYLIIGGPPLGMAYKAVNTLDSMVGYKNEKYLKLGWASARCDDLANYIPARITGILMIVAAVFLGKDWKNAYATLRKDAKKHMSPNSGYPESAVAGALRVQLGGVNYYAGNKKVTPLLGQDIEELSDKSIEGAVRMMYLASSMMVLLGVLFLGVLK